VTQNVCPSMHMFVAGPWLGDSLCDSVYRGLVKTCVGETPCGWCV